MNRRFVCVLAVAGVITAPAASAQTPSGTLSLEEALELAAERSLASIDARGDVEVARAAVVGASLTPYNPELEVGGGPRFGPTELTPNVEVGVGQRFELGGRRKARAAFAEANVDVATARVEEVERQTLTDVAELYLRAVHAERRLEIARRSVELAAELQETAQKRLDAGETNRLEVNTALLGRERHQVQLELWRGRVTDLHGRLRALLGRSAESEVSLSTSLELPALGGLDELTAGLTERPDLRRLRTAIEAEAVRERLARAQGWPAIGLRLGYAREEGADILKAALAVPLPLFSRGQGTGAKAVARSAALSARLEARERQALTELTTAWNRWRRLQDAAGKFRNDVLPLLENNEVMVRRAYEAGSVDLTDTLAMRREMIEAREAYTDLLLEAALANVRVRAASGTLGRTE